MTTDKIYKRSLGALYAVFGPPKGFSVSSNTRLLSWLAGNNL